MPKHLDLADPRYNEAGGPTSCAGTRPGMTDEHETNITSAVRDFILLTAWRLGTRSSRNTPPAPGSLNAVDLKVLDTFIEVKSRIGTTGGGTPDPRHVAQLDGYLDQAQAAGEGIQMGVLTDGKYWLLRGPGADKDHVVTAPPHAFTLSDAAGWFDLYEWLRDRALALPVSRPLNRDSIKTNFGATKPGLPARY